MSLYVEYLNEIEARKNQNLDPKPIDSAELLNVLIEQIRDINHRYRLQFAPIFQSKKSH